MVLGTAVCFEGGWMREQSQGSLSSVGLNTQGFAGLSQRGATRRSGGRQ